MLLKNNLKITDFYSYYSDSFVYDIIKLWCNQLNGEINFKVIGLLIF